MGGRFAAPQVKIEKDFEDSQFDGDISGWDVSNVQNMEGMFQRSHFYGDISGWDVSNVQKMEQMFEYSPLAKKLPKWCRE